ncbi:uroporphyrinogen-III C-methyltransferase [Carnimonas bestiolae]|uniref:uroporphyrinogen-III C-methyltransferase n=1 Tax=Carnimonas bestiolae TaxID=3402172 RepID=UPI003EDC2A77
MSKKEEHNKGSGVELPSSSAETSANADNSSSEPKDAHDQSHVKSSSTGDSEKGAKGGRDSTSASSAATADDSKDSVKADKPAPSTSTTSSASSASTAKGADAATSKGAASTPAGAAAAAASKSDNASASKSTSTSASSNSSTKTSSGGADKRGGGAQPPKKRGGTPQWLIVLLAVLLVLVLVGLGWNLQRINDQHDRVDQLSQQVKSLSGEGQQRIQQALSDSQQSTDSLDQRLGENEQTIKHVLDELNRHQQTDSREWTYAEVEYLLRIANQRLGLERDIDGAQKLLHTADERLASTGNPAFVPVRRAISDELSELDSVANVDREGIYLQLASAQQQFDKLPLAQDTEALKAKAESSDEFSGNWRQQLGRLGDQLKDLVTVRHHDQPLEALITPQQEGYLRENVRLQLEQAQLALLRQDPKIFKSSLEQAASLVDKYYRSDDSGVQKALQHLKELSEVQVRPDIPDISGSLEQLRETLSRRSSAADAEQGE